MSFAENMGQEVGRGLMVGGAANGSPLGWTIASVGSIIDFVSGAFGSKSLDQESPENRARLEKMHKMQIDFACKIQFREYLKPSPQTTLNEIQAKADAFCEDLDKAVQSKGYLQVNRSELIKMTVMEGFLPPGEGDVISYKLAQNPFKDCTNDLYIVGKNMVTRAKSEDE